MDILQAMAQAAGNQGGDEDGMTPIQVIERLRSVHGARSEKETFEPGDILVHKYPGLADSVSKRQPFMFVRYLDRPVSPVDFPEAFQDVTDWASNMVPKTFDCVAATVRRDTYVEFLEESQRWRKATESDFNGHAGEGD